MSFVYQSEQWLSYPVPPVFAFFANPENLPRLMPEWQQARIDHLDLRTPSHSATKTAGLGSLIDLSFRASPRLPLRLTWQAEITQFEHNSHFQDVQLKGPFEDWTHTHRFRSLDTVVGSTTFMVDRIEYTPPLWILGSAVNALFIRKQLDEMFAYRRQRVTELLAAQFEPAPRAPRSHAS